ncbi:MAG: alpha-hydroxy-acid oxidizing protein [Thermoleophilaceae bacterium]|nr:alpha-hydroxy-acid oxidizing protein [Thermoleophilaceae bacterium]
MDTEFLNVADYERLAEQALEPGPYGYFAGGACDERTLRDNVDAYGRWQLRPRMLVDVSEVTTETTVMGAPASMPLLVAPTAFQKLCSPEGEAATARAAAAAGTVMCLSTLATSAPAEVAAAAPGGRRWFQVYVFKDEGITRALVDQAVESGFEALVLTVDAPGAGGRRERDLRTGFEIPAGTGVPSLDAAFGGRSVTVSEAFAAMDATLTWPDLERIAGLTELPLLVKGVLTSEDAALACEHGADGVIVSNHGGRQLDGVPATLDALPEVAEAVEGRIEVLVDGGVRRGTDVVKALALGARAALIGRPVLWGLAARGEEGVTGVLELMREEIALALRLVGAPAPQAVAREHVQRAPH